MLRFLAVLALALSAHASAPHVGPEIPLAPPDVIEPLGAQTSPAIASRGEDAFAVWSDQRSNFDDASLLGSRVADDGTFLDPQGILLDGKTPTNPTLIWDDLTIEPQIAWTGTEYFVVYTRGEPYPRQVTTYLQRVAPDGTFTPKVKVAGLTSIRLYGNGREAMVSGWRDGEQYFARLAADGTASDLVKLPSSSTFVFVADGADWVYFRVSQLCDPDCSIKMRQGRIRGTKIVSERLLPLSFVRMPFDLAAATDGNGRFMVVWSDVRSGSARSYRGGITYLVTNAAGELVSGLAELDRVEAAFPDTLQVEAAPDSDPSVAWSNGEFVAVWTWFDGNGRRDIRASGVSRDGKAAAREPFVVDTLTQPFSYYGRPPAVAATPSRVHVLWPQTRRNGTRTETELLVRSLHSPAAVASAPPALSATTGSTRHDWVDVAANDEGVLTVWGETSATTSVVRGRLVRYDGSESPLLTMGDAVRRASYPVVSFSGDVWLVTWTENILKDRLGVPVVDGQRRMALRLDRDARPLDEEPLEWHDTAARFPLPAAPAGGPDLWFGGYHTSTNGTHVLVTWSERYSQARGCLYAQLFHPDGTPAEEKQTLHCGIGMRGTASRPQSVWDGTRFLVVYSFDDAMWLETLDGTRVQLFATTGGLNLYRPVMTPVGLILTYTRAATGFGTTPRVFRRTVSFDGPRRRAVR